MLWLWHFLYYSVGPHLVASLHIYTFVVSRAFMAGAASQAGDADSSQAPGLTSGSQESVNVHRGALLFLPQWQCISSFVFYIDINSHCGVTFCSVNQQIHSEIMTIPTQGLYPAVTLASLSSVTFCSINRYTARLWPFPPQGLYPAVTLASLSSAVQLLEVEPWVPVQEFVCILIDYIYLPIIVPSIIIASIFLSYILDWGCHAFIRFGLYTQLI